MKHAKAKRHARIKAGAVAAAALVAGIGFLVLSRMVIASGEKAAAEARTAQTQPGDAAEATAPTPPSASAPSDAEAGSKPTAPSGRIPPADPQAVASQKLGGLLLLFSLMCFAVTATAVAWIFYDVRRSRPAWMRQTRYPVHERRK